VAVWIWPVILPATTDEETASTSSKHAARSHIAVDFG
jgi:hypothetical protein